MEEELELVELNRLRELVSDGADCWVPYELPEGEICMAVGAAAASGDCISATAAGETMLLSCCRYDGDCGAPDMRGAVICRPVLLKWACKFFITLSYSQAQ